MPYVPFYEKFPELADKETRVLTVLDDPELPSDEYGFIEAYCDEPDCDCRRVFFNVFSGRQKRFVAVIAYGWGSKRFYAKWFGANDPKIIRSMQGPILNDTSPQSKLAPVLLDRVKNLLLKDPLYVERLKQHYAMFRKAVKQEYTAQAVSPQPASPKKIRRNASCPCGSGKKYKHCCGKVA
jgi:hypothetical protein